MREFMYVDVYVDGYVSFNYRQIINTYCDNRDKKDTFNKDRPEKTEQRKTS